VIGWGYFVVYYPLRYIDPTGHNIDCSPNDYQCQVEAQAEENADDDPGFDDSLGGNNNEDDSLPDPDYYVVSIYLDFIHLHIKRE
jgi:hypothetical protein